MSPLSYFTLSLTLATLMACSPQAGDEPRSDNLENRLILVTGATGQQGGAVARELLARGYTVRALTRNPNKESAQALAAAGARLVQGDFEDRESLDLAMADAYGVFAMQDFWEHGYEGEVRQGRNAADAAKAAGIRHFVYSSVASADRNTGIPHFESKFAVEEHIRAIGLPYTILRPVSFMGWERSREQIMEGRLVHALDADTPQQYIALQDIGMFAAEAFDRPGDWIGRELDIAGDQLSMTELAQMFSRIAGREVRYTQIPWSELEQRVGRELTLMFKWFDDVGYDVDIDSLASRYPLTSVEAYLRQGGW